MSPSQSLSSYLLPRHPLSVATSRAMGMSLSKLLTIREILRLRDTPLRNSKAMDVRFLVWKCSLSILKISP
nr:hypothetical protein I308_04390 [Cryptococcus tetragattii IND107]